MWLGESARSQTICGRGSREGCYPLLACGGDRSGTNFHQVEATCASTESGELSKHTFVCPVDEAEGKGHACVVVGIGKLAFL